MKKVVVIFAGGTGQRMGDDIPKQFMKVQGREIIVHTLEKFDINDNIDEIIVVCIEDWIPYLNKLVARYDLEKVVSVIPGGVSGQDSIFKGLDEAKKRYDNAIVLIHDGVRPLITEETINKCVETVQEYGSAITVTPAFETPLVSYDGTVVEEMPPRKNVYTAQAPQSFYLSDIYRAHILEREINPDYEGIVDSCNLMFKNGVQCHLVEGNRGNLKVTTPEDYITLLGNSQAEDFKQLIKLQDNRKAALETEKRQEEEKKSQKKDVKKTEKKTTKKSVKKTDK